MEEKNLGEKKIMFSGIQPSGDLTLGSYMGAIKNWVDMIDDYNAYYCIVDMHAITVRQVPADLRRRTMEQLAQYIACGLDPEKVTLFIQSHNPCHAELGWVLNCYTMFGELSRMTQFKGQERQARRQHQRRPLYLSRAHGRRYPALPDRLCPCRRRPEAARGADARRGHTLQHVYGETFKVPQAYIPRVGARIMSLQDPTSKMSQVRQRPQRLRPPA